VGAAAAGFSIDLIRKTLDLDIPYIFLLGAVTMLMSLVAIIWFIRRYDAENVIQDDEGHIESVSQGDSKTGMAVVKAVVMESVFKRMLVLMAVMLGVRAVFLYLYLLLPIYWTRTIEAVSGWFVDPTIVEKAGRPD
jgi:hypothetical protein